MFMCLMLTHEKEELAIKTYKNPKTWAGLIQKPQIITL